MCIVLQISGLPVSGHPGAFLCHNSFLVTQVGVNISNNIAESSTCSLRRSSILTSLPRDPAKLRRSLQYPINPPQIMLPQAFHMPEKTALLSCAKTHQTPQRRGNSTYNSQPQFYVAFGAYYTALSLKSLPSGTNSRLAPEPPSNVGVSALCKCRIDNHTDNHTPLFHHSLQRRVIPKSANYC